MQYLSKNKMVPRRLTEKLRIYSPACGSRRAYSSQIWYIGTIEVKSNTKIGKLFSMTETYAE